jgi:putative ABC transport system permease protein
VRSDLENYPYNLQPGASITLKEPGTGVVKSVRVVGFYRRERRVRTFGSFFTPPIYGDRSIALALGRDDAEATVSFNIDQSQLTYDAAQLQRAVPGALVVDIGDLTAAVETILNELLNVLAVITGLVLGAGVAVVANGVVLAMLERRREIALFKAVGFGGGSVLRFVLVENALIGTLAGAVSVLAAAISLRLLSHYALQQAVGFDPVLAVIVMAVAAALAVVTAYVVARKPLRVRPLEALRND